MRASALDHLLRRDRYVVAGAIAVLAALAWAYILWLGHTMRPQPQSSDGMGGMAMLTPALAVWDTGSFVFMFAMWAVMMIGMMTPSVAPMLLLYARVGRQAVVRGQPFAATGWFAGGYLAAWIGFALAATALQWALENLALLTPQTLQTGNMLGGAILIAAGIYQWTPVKAACLSRCRAPLLFIQQHGGFRAGAYSALWLGVAHGAYCIGCCWMLMMLLFAGGVMNVLWIAGLTIFVLLENITLAGPHIARFSGILLFIAGAALLSGRL